MNFTCFKILLFDSTLLHKFKHSKSCAFFGGSRWNTSSRVGKIVHWTIFTFVSACSSPARNLVTSFSIPHFSIKLSTAFAVLFWWFEVESNHRHEDFQSSALPTELSNHTVFYIIKKWRPGTGSNRRPLA